MNKSPLRHCYEYCESIPDRLYPFAVEVEGTLVLGYQAYQHTVARAVTLYGPNALGYKIQVYRAVCHVIGSMLFIIGAATIAHSWFGSEVVLYVLLVSAMIALFVQEFISHPARYGQTMRKNITDWLT